MSKAPGRKKRSSQKSEKRSEAAADSAPVEKKRGGDDTAEVEDGGPGQVFMSYVVMEDLTDKLKLLNYESAFIKQLNMKPFYR